MKTYQEPGSLVFAQIVQDIRDTTLATSESVTDFANKLRRLNNEAERVGAHCKLPETWMVQMFIRGLDEEFESFITSFCLSHSIVGEGGSAPVTFDLIVKKASEHENLVRNLAAFRARAAAVKVTATRQK
ncbi:hypothetical protein A1O3_08917 [Capronia epimyces CBS 606.96]|uniref:Uncharacterized protein n=1 Tax=Capronia epimyces CBS 606.96 TaxID=1182542 RepID=W9XQ31_9EURO|nr:uncharacterized protein A1O3_08917 [Capronia epimyces CBS 606.96]EXJ79415.1 hypothetical protein A1O3_08917 [Capronia epimyces CBS 606.96]